MVEEQKKMFQVQRQSFAVHMLEHKDWRSASVGCSFSHVTHTCANFMKGS